MTSQNITGINPNQAMQGQTVPLIISGNNMSFSGWSCFSNTGNLTNFRFSQWSGTNMIYGTSTSATSTQLSGNISVPAFQPIGIYNLEVFDCLNSWWIQYPNSFQITLATSIEEHTTKKGLIKIIDLSGREIKQTNQPLFYIYNDGTVEKRIIIE